MTTKKVSPAKALPPPKAIAEILLIPIDRIEVLAQVRKQFDNASIAELAADIEARGLRQPVEVTPISDERYLLTLGERRFRAIKLLGQKMIPATVVKTSTADRLVNQLAENIQREDLDLADQVDAIRELHNKLKSVAAVCAVVKKSPAWVSKRLALSHPDYCITARHLMEDGITEDVEILNIVNHLAAMNVPACNKLVHELRNGKATRESARAALAAVKAELKAKAPTKPATLQDIEAQQQKLAAESKAHKERTEGHGKPFVTWAWSKLDDMIYEPCEEKDVAAKWYDTLKAEQKAALIKHVRERCAELAGMTLAQWAPALNNGMMLIDVLLRLGNIKELGDNTAFKTFLNHIEDANRTAALVKMGHQV